MSAFSSPSRGARGKALAPHLASVFLLLLCFGVASAEARTRTTVRGSQGKLDVVSSTGDTVHLDRQVTGVTLSGEGIRIQGGGQGQRTIRVPGRHGAPDVNIDVDMGLDDSTLRAYGYDHHGSGDIVQMFENVHIDKNRIVDGDVVSIFGSADVQGRVLGQVVSIMGDVTAGDSAHIGGDVVTVGGTLRSSPTAEIQGQTVSVPIFGTPRVARWLPGAAMIASVLFFALLGALLALLFPERLVRVADTVSRRTFLSFLLGLLAFPALPVVLVVLCITVVGIPVAILLVLLFPVATFVGYVASCALMGARMTRTDVSSPPVWRSVIVGLVFVGAFFLIGWALTNLGPGGLPRVLGFSFFGLGLVIASVSSLLGLGALFLSRLGEPEREPQGGVPSRPPGVPVGSYAPAPPTS